MSDDRTGPALGWIPQDHRTHHTGLDCAEATDQILEQVNEIERLQDDLQHKKDALNNLAVEYEQLRTALEWACDSLPVKKAGKYWIVRRPGFASDQFGRTAWARLTGTDFLAPGPSLTILRKRIP